MTNLKSVDNYRFMTAEPFVMNNSIYCLIDGVQLVIYTIAPDLLPFSQTVVRDTENEVTTRKLYTCDGQRKSRLSCSISSLITRNVDMTWNPAENNTFSRICRSSIILQDFLHQIYFQFKSAQSLQARHRVREDDEVLISTATDDVK